MDIIAVSGERGSKDTQMEKRVQDRSIDKIDDEKRGIRSPCLQSFVRYQVFVLCNVEPGLSIYCSYSGPSWWRRGGR